MSEEKSRIAVIIGSTREGRRGPAVADWLLAQTAQHSDLETDLIDLAEDGPPLVMSSSTGTLPPAVTALGERLAAADGFIVVTPEYNHSFPAPLKNAIDWYHQEWQAKPVAFVSYGAISGGLRAVEQLRAVFAELHATTIRDTVSFHQVWNAVTPQGVIEPSAERDAAAKSMLGQLMWWADALRQARRRTPYTG